MPPDGVNISNREIYDAVVELGRKVDDHLARHDERDKASATQIEHGRAKWQIRAALAAAVVSGVISTLGALKP